MTKKAIILDTNIFCADYLLNSKPFVLLESFIDTELKKFSNIRLHLPDIILQEVLKNYEKEYNKRRKELEKASNHYEKLIFNKSDPPLINESYDVNLIDYKKYFLGKLNNITSGNLIQENECNYIKIENLRDRCLEKKKPFAIDEGDKGFKDALIWEYILYLNKQNDYEIIFISNNSKDFGKNNELDESLKDELGKLITYKNSVDELFPYVQEQNLQKINEYMDFEKSFPDKYDEIIKWLLTDLFNYIDEDFPYDPDNSDDFELDFTLKESKYLYTKDSIDYIKQNYSFITYITYYIGKTEFYVMDEDECKSIHICDFDWNDHVIQAEKIVEGNVSLYILINQNDKSIDEIEFFKMSEVTIS